MATNLPFTGEFKVTAIYGQKGSLWTNGVHGGIDLVSLDQANYKSKVYAICNGIVEYAGWENAKDPKQGFGMYVRIREDGTNNKIYLAHLASLKVKAGDRVSRTKIVGMMGATGKVTGAHTHVEIRNNGIKLNPANYMGIPNAKGNYNSKNYQINESNNIEVGKIKIISRMSYVRNEPTLKSSLKYTYLPNTRVTILASNIAQNDGYHWDKIRVNVTSREGYIATNNGRYR